MVSETAAVTDVASCCRAGRLARISARASPATWPRSGQVGRTAKLVHSLHAGERLTLLQINSNQEEQQRLGS